MVKNKDKYWLMTYSVNCLPDLNGNIFQEHTSRHSSLWACELVRLACQHTAIYLRRSSNFVWQALLRGVKLLTWNSLLLVWKIVRQCRLRNTDNSSYQPVLKCVWRLALESPTDRSGERLLCPSCTHHRWYYIDTGVPAPRWIRKSLI